MATLQPAIGSATAIRRRGTWDDHLAVYRTTSPQVTEDQVFGPSTPHCTLDLACSNIPALAQALAVARTANALVDVLQKLQVH